MILFAKKKEGRKEKREEKGSLNSPLTKGYQASKSQKWSLCHYTFILDKIGIHKREGRILSFPTFLSSFCNSVLHPLSASPLPWASFRISSNKRKDAHRMPRNGVGCNNWMLGSQHCSHILQGGNYRWKEYQKSSWYKSKLQEILVCCRTPMQNGPSFWRR